MDLKLKFPGLLFRNCEIYNGDRKLASLKRKWTLYVIEIGSYRDNKWEFREKGFIKTKIIVTDLVTKRLLGTIDIENKKQLLGTIGTTRNDLAFFNIQGKSFQLTQNAQGHFVWLDDKNSEIANYDFSHIFSRTFNRECPATIVENPTKDYILLLMLGIYLIKMQLLLKESVTQGFNRC